MSLRYLNSANGVVDSAGNVVLKIMFRDREYNHIRANLFANDDVFHLVAHSIRVVGDDGKKYGGWRIVEIDENARPVLDRVIKPLLDRALQAYGLTNGFGSDEPIFTEYQIS